MAVGVETVNVIVIPKNKSVSVNTCMKYVFDMHFLLKIIIPNKETVI